ncbi:bacillithiol biosynthesis cysteine-adding enzyme BshC [Caldalkalibacillus salinus]|uniref:bacillithiol biosynthesis cysteine-adding enzyme BshC n=1 Tax=Caldalkalibacillus salinus TaxID=2803787 RepID=UPI001921B1FF|nr:bacillithiol biosynthesis cysteine-adding enzyme BshC [Caldalkalibacillus salinus]
MNLHVKEHSIDQLTSFGTDYIHHFDRVAPFFHYHPFAEDSYRQRVEELRQQNFPRKGLADVIRSFHQKWGIHPNVEENLRKLEDSQSVVVIGGQQAGLLLGPLYTLHKVISILTLARQQEKELGIPVVPVFWIAGEDHDYHEINHVFVPGQNENVTKLSLSESEQSRTSMSYLSLPKDEVRAWLNQFFESQPETEFSHELKDLLLSNMEQSTTFVDYFASLLHHLFQDYGLLMIDSADEALRTLETEMFKQVIERYEEIDGHVRQGISDVMDRGYQPQVQLGEYPALLFVQDQEGRLLLEKIEDGFQAKVGGLHLSKDELLKMAENEPQRLSHNVVTRPLMQEMLFPTLAFVAGPGETSYWALYKGMFESFGKKMPVLAPRMSMTLIEKPIAKILSKREMPVDTVFGHMDRFRQQWLKEQDHLQLETTFTQLRENIHQAYEPVLQKLENVPGMDALGSKNIEKVLTQVDYLEKRSVASLKSQHDVALRQFDKVEQSLFPLGKLQERTHNPFTFFNKHGMVLVKHLLDLPLEANGQHKLIYIQ